MPVFHLATNVARGDLFILSYEISAGTYNKKSLQIFTIACRVARHLSPSGIENHLKMLTGRRL